MNVRSRENVADLMEMPVLSPPADVRQCAILLDIDGTILDIAPTPREVSVPPTLRHTLARLQELTGGALALVSGRLLADIDLIFAPLKLAAVGGHGAELRSMPNAEPQRRAASLSPELRRSLARLTALGPGILVEDKGYSLALHYRLAPELAPALQAAVVAICDQMPAGTVDVLPGKAVVEVKPVRVG
jgi:trehalose 6-phosphate phosphatase